MVLSLETGFGYGIHMVRDGRRSFGGAGIVVRSPDISVVFHTYGKLQGDHDNFWWSQVLLAQRGQTHTTTLAMAPKKEVEGKKFEPKRAGDDAVIGFGAHERGGSVSIVAKALGCDDTKAMSILAQHGGDHVNAIRANKK